MKKLFAVLVLCSTMATAQVHRFVYEYKYIPNINEKEKVMDDLMVWTSMKKDPATKV